MSLKHLAVLGLALPLLLTACSSGAAPSTSGSAGSDQIVVGLITKTETNPFFVKMKEAPRPRPPSSA